MARQAQDHGRMAERKAQYKQKRRMRATSVAALVESRVRRAGESRGFAVTRLLTHWEEVVGPDFAAIARPVKVTYGRGDMGATLVVLTTGAQAPMLEMQKDTLRARINACYGYSAISRITLTQTAPVGFSEGQAVFTSAPKAHAAPDPAVTREAAEVAAPVADEGLRKALQQLACNVLAANKRKR
jgi:hypothetical protein